MSRQSKAARQDLPTHLTPHTIARRCERKIKMNGAGEIKEEEDTHKNNATSPPHLSFLAVFRLSSFLFLYFYSKPSSLSSFSSSPFSNA